MNTSNLDNKIKFSSVWRNLKPVFKLFSNHLQEQSTGY